jgi:hypothetical protein
MFGENRMLYHIPLTKNLCYDTSLSFEKKWMRVGPIRSKQSYSFEHEEIKKPLPLPEILGLLKAPTQRESRKLS